MKRLQGQSVLILGLGESGLAMARWCARAGASVTVADTRGHPPGLDTLRLELPAVRFVSGGFEALDLAGVHRVLKSPGLPPTDAGVAHVLHGAAQAGLARQGELALFMEAMQDLKEERGYTPKLLGVTGTNGKTTVTSLTALLMARAGLSVQAAGNISPSLLDALRARLDADELPEAWVLELSSFQLDDTGLGQPVFRGDTDLTASVVLNLSQDHLDWHGSFEHYARAKSLIYGDQGICVMNRDDPTVMHMTPSAAGTAKAGKLSLQAQRAAQARVLTFGLTAPQRPGDFGFVLEGGMAWLVRAHESDETRRRKAGDEEEITLQRLMPADALRIRGRHNTANALASLALATAAGCPMAPMLHGLREYRGEPHRAQWVARVGEVDFIDDSKGTNVGATVAAIEGLGPDQRLVLILGGQGKGQDFTPLAAPIARFVRAVVLIGEDAGLIERAIASAAEQAGVKIVRAADMPAAVAEAAQLARPSEAVLLSPACASFDMFKGYAHRAAVFVEAVEALAADRGEVMT
jgi:UDP-N-acetylmuramoylalanine--D-glutamate ligase